MAAVFYFRDQLITIRYPDGDGDDGSFMANLSRSSCKNLGQIICATTNGQMNLNSKSFEIENSLNVIKFSFLPKYF